MGRAAPAPPARGSTLLVTVQEKRKAKLSSDTPHPAGGLSGAPKAVRCSERARQKPGEVGVTRKAPRPSLCATGKETPLCAEGCGWQRNCRQGLDKTGTDSKGVAYSASSLMQDTSLLGYPSPRNPPHWPYPKGHPQPGAHPLGWPRANDCFHGYMPRRRSWPCKRGDLEVSGHVAVPWWLAGGGASSSGSREASGRGKWAWILDGPAQHLQPPSTWAQSPMRGGGQSLVTLLP